MMSMDQSLQNKQGWGLFLAAEETPVFFRVPGLDFSQSVPLGPWPSQGYVFVVIAQGTKKSEQEKRQHMAELQGRGGCNSVHVTPHPILSHLPQCLRWGRTHTRGASKVLVNGRKERKKAERQVCVGRAGHPFPSH